LDDETISNANATTTAATTTTPTPTTVKHNNAGVASVNWTLGKNFHICIYFRSLWKKCVFVLITTTLFSFK
jgi:hypothetical protein